MKYSELKALIKEEITAAKSLKETPVQEEVTSLEETEMMSDPVSLQFFIGLVTTLVSGFSLAVWKGMKDNEKEKLKKAAAKFDAKQVKDLAEKAVEETYAN